MLSFPTPAHGRVINTDEKTAKQFGKTFSYARSDCVFNYLNMNKFIVALSTIYDTFLHISK